MTVAPIPDDLERIPELLAGIPSSRRRRLFEDLLRTAIGMVTDETDTLNLKIASAALQEMREAFEMFQPYGSAKKVAIFGSARTRPDDPFYAQARDVAGLLARRDWMVITGAGPGIMQAAMEGAGRERSIGVSIRLPFEQSANPVIAGDSKYVSMKYFFTRKLMLIKEAAAYVCLPGGFGTLDETLELLTLTQTGKGLPAPIVLLDTPGERFWAGLTTFIDDDLVRRGLVSPSDVKLYRVTDSCEEAVAEIERFYGNYQSLRYVGDRLVLRLLRSPSDALLAEANLRYGHLCATGAIERSGPLSVEVRDDDVPDLPRVALHFANRGFGDLRGLIDLLNTEPA